MNAPAFLTFKELMAKNPAYCGQKQTELEAMYKGGRHLFENQHVINRVFPRHRDEHELVYEQRKARAFYIPYAGEIIDHLVASMLQEPIRMGLGDDAEIDDYYQDLQEDISPPGGEKCSLNELLKEQVLTAFVKGKAWTLVDMPEANEAFPTLGEQEKSGALSGYAVPVSPESVLDWECDSSGALLWAIVYSESKPRPTPFSPRDTMLRTWTIYTREGWARYQLAKKSNETVGDNDKADLIGSGLHSFGAVPLIRLSLPDGLWAMAKMEGIAKEIFNKASALSWAQYNSLFPELYEYDPPKDASCGTEIGVSQPSGNATAQKRGQGYVQERPHGASAGFVGPDTSGFEHASKHLQEMRDEMHRVSHQMALTLDNNSAALRRSAESKAHDKASQAVILTAVGQVLRDHCERIFNMLSAARMDAEFVGEWKASGMEKFDATDTSGIVAEAVELSTVDIPSKRFQVLHKLKVCRAVLGEDIGEEAYDEIEKELEESISSEALAPKLLPDPGAMKDDEDEPEDGEGESDSAKDEQQPE